ncbi:DEHA2E12122p [Debaryomyces hansenii CBS767]|uniref:Ras modification protein ERF4 n=1 Tax=Debaryomyces hansenii (strain ATCC 36239 / CBS 767 / BCRC 21394 / JCM 1990 / NBRC 0083 / IGC 2968) TaxID=284592 RepID=ERFD_DEBHA|nr:DEHA2E12122p [Debaryomyces hansenii CBS767]Q6BPN7.2 RecName: Full=Ras modification protein ERF4 [Debaryomyces hansenii CBS767]CAG88072.2 DEHA2E12122p [Debaryomyces hansenii CBS767]|eukprot:XP_459833.2 DEHA2E12122p [Debaryomyces hansenii CBS767]
MQESSTKHVVKEDNITNNGENENNGITEPLLFFNYHEFLTENYNVHPSCRHNSKARSIVVNHFPNNHVPIDSSMYSDTRIVRIPRIFNTIQLSDIIPQFSNYTPGTEPAAINDQQGFTFKPVGIYDNNSFGETSVTPLVPGYMTEEEFHTIIDNINKYLHEAFSPYNVWNLFDSILDLLSANFYNKIVNNFLVDTYSKRKLLELEMYIENDINLGMFASRPGLKILSPRKSGYLSVCIDYYNSHQNHCTNYLA